ncbi:MAG: hypothetical protein L6Q95_01445 [Planctomycetes bacterium]|nr:hypothetical protein [Planctomycetota bacterium]
MRLLPLFLAILLVAPACGRKKQPPPPTPQPSVQAPVGPPKVIPPAGVPMELKNLVERKWPQIVKDGNAFLDKYKEFQGAQAAGDRAAMAAIGEDANGLFERANEAWAEIYYWADNMLGDGEIDEATAEICRKFLSDYNKQVTEWTKKNKVLKEFSTAK